MSDPDRLTMALREARLSEAAKLEASLDLRDAKSLRLDALRTAVVPHLRDHPQAVEMFNLVVQPGARPRLWIDLVSSVVMEPDPRTYRVLQDNDGQRQTLFESTDLRQTEAFVLRYLAHRVVAHDKALLGLSRPAFSAEGKYSVLALVYVWATGCAFGILGLLIVAMLLGRLHF